MAGCNSKCRQVAQNEAERWKLKWLPLLPQYFHPPHQERKHKWGSKRWRSGGRGSEERAQMKRLGSTSSHCSYSLLYLTSIWPIQTQLRPRKGSPIQIRKTNLVKCISFPPAAATNSSRKPQSSMCHINTLFMGMYQRLLWCWVATKKNNNVWMGLKEISSVQYNTNAVKLRVKQKQERLHYHLDTNHRWSKMCLPYLAMWKKTNTLYCWLFFIWEFIIYDDIFSSDSLC